MRIAVLVSGSGTNLQAIIDAGLPVSVVLSDRPDVVALDRANRAGIPTVVVDRNQWMPDREKFTQAVIDALVPFSIDLIALAGFMTILSAGFIDVYPGRVVNTHPSLLPAFKGAHAVRDALAAGVPETGCTIHYVVPEVDAGPIIEQVVVPVEADDTEDTLTERIKAAEQLVYPRVLARLIAERTASDPTVGG